MITFLICSCHHTVTSSQHNLNDQMRETQDQMKENQDQSVKFGNIFISSALPSQPQFSPLNNHPPFYGPRPRYETGSGFAGFLEMLNLPYLSQRYNGLPAMGLESSGSSSDRIRFEVSLIPNIHNIFTFKAILAEI